MYKGSCLPVLLSDAVRNSSYLVSNDSLRVNNMLGSSRSLTHVIVAEFA
jgi:hypothetical protein